MKYNKALDLMAAAAIFAKEGRVNAAAKTFTAAVNDPSMQAALKVIEASNLKAYSQVKANEGLPAENVGEEFREDVPENGDRVVQQASAKSLRAQARKLVQQADAMDSEEDDSGDADLSFLDGVDATADADGDLDMDDMDDDTEGFGPESASFVKAFGARASGKAPVKAAAAPAAAAKKVEASAFARAVRNMNAIKK